MNFAVIFKGILQTLIVTAEQELGAGKGAEKKAWVLSKLDEALKAANLNATLAGIIHAVASIVLDFLVTEAMTLLGK